jgi:type I restriction enzyme R subunit
MVDHFHEQVIDRRKIGGEARAMVVCSSIERALQYYHAISAYLLERKSPYKAIAAFSGEPEYQGAKVTEASINGIPSSKIAEQIRENPYRFLVCADKFQTGYDEPLLHTMYVDKPLSGVKAVQTLSRLNRANPKKHDVFVLDFQNDSDTIEKAFAPYYRTTVLSEETDPNKLHDLKADLDGYEIYDADQIDDFVALYLGGADREQLDIILDACVATYVDRLDEDGQVDFKAKCKTFVRTYGFLAAILPYTNAEWEKLSIFLGFLTPKLPAPKEEDLSRGVLETIDMESYRAEKSAAMKIQLPDEDGEIEPVPAAGGATMPELEIDQLSNILKSFNEMFGAIQWADADRVQQLVTEGLRRRGVSERAGEQRQAERPDRTRRCAGPGDDVADQRRHGALQAVQRQRVVPQVAARHRVRSDVSTRGTTRDLAESRRAPSIRARRDRSRLLGTERGTLGERMMGLEPTTFCMASRRSSQLSYIRVGGPV